MVREESFISLYGPLFVGDQLKGRVTNSESLGWAPSLLVVGVLLLLFAVVASTLEVLPTSLLGRRMPDVSVSEWYSFVLVVAIALSLLVLYQASRSTGSRLVGSKGWVLSRTDDLHLCSPPAVFWWVLLFALVCILMIPLLWRIGWLPTLHYPIFGFPRL
jgi:hypothetical protein